MRGESENTNTANGQSKLGTLIATITRKILENDAFEVDLQELAAQDPKQAAQSILALLEGKVMLAKLHDNPELIGGFDADIARLLGGVSKAAATG